MVLPRLTNLVPRPDHGTDGRRTTVLANIFTVTKTPKTSITHYDIDISPEVKPQKGRRVFECMVDIHLSTVFGNLRPVYDGKKNAFTAHPLSFDHRVFDVVLPGDVGRKNAGFKVRISKVAKIDLEELHQFVQRNCPTSSNILSAMQSLQIILNHKPAMLYAHFGRSLYIPDGAQALAGGIQVWKGYYQSVRPAIDRVFVNIDVSATAFYAPGSLLEYVCKALGFRNPQEIGHHFQHLNPQEKIIEHRRLQRAVKGIFVRLSPRTVNTSGSAREFKVCGVSEKPASAISFEREVDGRSVPTMLIAYFLERYQKNDPLSQLALRESW